MTSESSVTYSCKILPLGNLLSVAIVVNLSLGVMYLGIFIGLPVFLNVLLLVGLMFVLLNFFSAHATFIISEDKLVRSLNTASVLFKNSFNKEHTWKDVKAYKRGTDKGKYRGEFQFLEIKFRNGDEWKMTDMYGERKFDFDLFLLAFSEYVAQFNQAHKTEQPVPATATIPLPEASSFIEREKTFYETIWAKVFTVLLGVFIIMIFLFAGPYMSGSSVFKMNFVLLPGFAYMFYRSFMKKERPD